MKKAIITLALAISCFFASGQCWGYSAPACAPSCIDFNTYLLSNSTCGPFIIVRAIWNCNADRGWVVYIQSSGYRNIVRMRRNQWGQLVHIGPLCVN